MSKKLTRMVALVLAGVMLLTVPGLVGCGEDGKGRKPEIVIGFLGDLSGPGAFAVAQTHDGAKYYITRYVQETNMIPEVNIKWIDYDSKGDRGRVQPGYKWLKGQGTDLITTISGDEAAILASALEKDCIPGMSAQASMPIMGSDWAWGGFMPPSAQGQGIMYWISENWDFGQGKAKVGLMGLGPLLISREVRDYVLPIVEASPDKYDWLGSYLVPYGTMAWASEIDHLESCDYIIVTAIGASMASFMKEARSRGYQGQFIGCMEAMLAFWGLVREIVPPEDLDGAVVSNPYVMWGEDVPWVYTMEKYVAEWFSGEKLETILMHCGWIGGWLNGTIMAAAIKQAVETVGAENVDGQAIRDALATVQIKLEGTDVTLEVGGGINCYLQVLRMWQYSASTDKWGVITDWYRPPVLGG